VEAAASFPGGGCDGGSGREGSRCHRPRRWVLLQGMSCGGCAASVKRILESEPQVQSATVNLATEMAVVWAVPEDWDAQNWKEQLGEKLASQLTTCGYKSNLRDSSKVSSQAVFERKMHEKLEQLKQSGKLFG